MADIQKEISAAYKKAGVPFRNVWQTAGFGEINLWVSVTPIAKFADMDKPSSLVQALGEEGSARLLARLNDLVVSTKIAAVLARPDLGLDSKSTDVKDLAIIVRHTVSPGKEAAYENHLKLDILPTAKKAKITDYGVYQTIFGGDPNEFVIVVPRANFAMLDGGSPLRVALGEQAYRKMMAKTADFLEATDISIARLRKDLGY